jgi:hypothetical protein
MFVELFIVPPLILLDDFKISQDKCYKTFYFATYELAK